MAAVLAPSQEGRKETAKLLLTGDPRDAPEALRIGLVNQIVPAEKLKNSVRELVERMLTIAPLSATFSKKAINSQLVEKMSDFKESLHTMISASQTEDFKE